MRTRIELGTSGSIDLSDDVPYSLNFAIADIRTPDKRDASYSKTIKIPGSKQNDKLFAHIFEVDINCNFNPNIKTPCILYIDEIPQIKGYLQLLKIYTTDELKVEYEVTIKGAIGNIFTAIGDGELTDLDYSEFNHAYNKTVQVASWTAPVGSGYVYPMIDYGQTNGVEYDVENFFPAVYLKTYIDKIFAYAGYTYSSNFFNSEFFKRLIIPYSGIALKMTEAEAAPREFLADMFLTHSFGITTTPTNPQTTIVIFDAELNDPSNQYNPTTGVFTCANTGVYSFASILPQFRVSAGTATGQARMMRYSLGVWSTWFIANIPTITTSYSSSVPTLLANVPLLAGDQFFIGLEIEATSGSSTLEYTGSATFVNTVINNGVIDGGLISMINAIPLKVKMKDLFTSIIRAFNLYIETDKNNDSQLNIEPRNDFYSSGTTIDWTSKWDVSQALVQEPMGALDGKKYIYTYTDDKDYYNTLYKNSFLETYGTLTYDVTNDFLTQSKENKILFSPTPLWDGSGTDRIISVMLPTDLTSTELKGTNLRLLYYGGVKTTAFSWLYTSDVAGNSSYTTYPYAGHLDNPENPTMDLNFGMAKEVYYNNGIWSNNHLFNKYHRQFLEEITDKDSKIITGWFYLTPLDIHTLDFRNQFFVDGHLLRLNKIYDYNPVKSTLTKCEFIKIKQAAQFVPTQKTSSGGINVRFTG